MLIPASLGVQSTLRSSVTLDPAPAMRTIFSIVVK